DGEKRARVMKALEEVRENVMKILDRGDALKFEPDALADLAPRPGMESPANHELSTPTQTPSRIDRLEQQSVEDIKQMARHLCSVDANDSGPAICAVWNLAAEA